MLGTVRKISLPRRLVADLMHASVRVPFVSLSRPLNVRQLAEVRAQAAVYLPYVVVVPVVSVWAFVFDGIYFGATRTAELRNGMAVTLALFAVTAALLVPAFGNHGLWLTFLIFLGGRALVLWLIYRRVGRAAAFVAA